MIKFMQIIIDLNCELEINMNKSIADIIIDAIKNQTVNHTLLRCKLTKDCKLVLPIENNKNIGEIKITVR